MKKMQIWEDYYNNENGFGYLYEEEDIEKAVSIDYDNYYLTNLNPDDFDLNDLTKKYQEFIKQKEEEDFYDKYNIIENLEEFFQELGINTEVFACTDEENLRNEIVFDWNDSTFEDLGSFDELEYVDYLDGQTNWVRHINDGYSDIVTTEITVNTDEEVCIDEWDGNNWQTGGVGEHEYISRVLEIDGSEVDDMWLVHRSSQWQGSRDKAKIMTREGLEVYLKGIGRDLEDYLQ